MDRINRALYGMEDNSMRISAIESELRAAPRSMGAAAVAGREVNDGAGARISFGSYNVSGSAAAIILFNGGSAEVKFGDELLTTGLSPVIVALPHGEGELCISTGLGGARAMVVGSFRKT